MPWYRVIVTKAMEGYVDAESAESARRDYTDLSYKDTGYGHVTAEPVPDGEAARLGCRPSEYPWVHSDRCKEALERIGCTCNPEMRRRPSEASEDASQ